MKSFSSLITMLRRLYIAIELKFGWRKDSMFYGPGTWLEFCDDCGVELPVAFVGDGKKYPSKCSACRNLLEARTRFRAARLW